MDISKNLTSLDWWLGVVVVSIVLNLFSAYLKVPLDGFLSRVSKWWDTRNEKARQERDSRIAKLKQSKDEQTFAAIQSLHEFASASMYFLGGLLFLAISELTKPGAASTGLLSTMGIICLIWSFQDLVNTRRRNYEISEARKEDAEVAAVLIKADGKRTEGIKGKITENGLLINNAKLLIEPKDTIELKLPKNLTETYEVLDEEEDSGLPPHKQASQLLKVRKVKVE
jgi:hypothetical protein